MFVQADIPGVKERDWAPGPENGEWMRVAGILTVRWVSCSPAGADRDLLSCSGKLVAAPAALFDPRPPSSVDGGRRGPPLCRTLGDGRRPGSRRPRLPFMEIRMMPRLLACLTLAGLVSLASPSSAPADDWPQWMGPGRDNVWRETGLLETLPKDGPKVVWRVPIAGGYSGPAVAGGRVYVTDYVTKDNVKTDNFDRKGSTGIERILCPRRGDRPGDLEVRVSDGVRDLVPRRSAVDAARAPGKGLQPGS